jgi:hypothetical protein
MSYANAKRTQKLTPTPLHPPYQPVPPEYSLGRLGTSVYRASLTMSALSSPFFFFCTTFLHTSPFTPEEWSSLRFFDLCFNDHGSLVIFRSASVRPRHLFDQNFDHDYFFKLPLQGAGCPITDAVFYFTPCPVPSCPTYEPNSNDGEYSQPFRHIQYNRTAKRRPIATLAMLL